MLQARRSPEHKWEEVIITSPPRTACAPAIVQWMECSRWTCSSGCWLRAAVMVWAVVCVFASRTISYRRRPPCPDSSSRVGSSSPFRPPYAVVKPCGALPRMSSSQVTGNAKPHENIVPRTHHTTLPSSTSSKMSLNERHQSLGQDVYQ